MTHGLIFILSAPSGCGKTTIARALVRSDVGLLRPASYTTRRPRPGEMDKRDYHFISNADFQKKKRRGEFLEWTKIYDEEYATPRDFIERAEAKGKDILLALDVKGAKSVRKVYPDCVTIFVLPPSIKELKARLTKRNKDSKAQIAKRLRLAKIEAGHLKEYDYFVINDDINEALKKLKAIVIAERARVVRWKKLKLLKQ